MTAAPTAAEPAPDLDDADDGRPWPSPARAWWVIAVFFVAAILYYTDRFILNLLVDPIRADLHITDTQVSLLQGVAFGLVYAFAGLPLGRFADVMPRRRVMIAGVVIWSVATAACGFAQSFGQLFAARVMVGIGEAALAPAAVSMIGDYFAPNRRGAAIGVFLTGMSIGNSMAIIISGSLLEAANGGLFAGLPVVSTLAPWRAVLVLLAIPAAVVVALLLTIREPERRGRKATSGAAMPLKAVVADFVSRRHILLPLYAAVALATIGDCALLNWTPALLQRRYHYTPGEVAAILGGVSLSMGIVGTLLGGFVSDYMHRRGGPRARLAAAFVASVLMVAGASVALAANGLQVVAIYGVWILMASVCETIGITTIQEVVPNQVRGVGASLVSFGNILVGMSLGTSLTAVLTDSVYRDPLAVGWSITTVAAPAGLLAALMFWLALKSLGRTRAATA